MRTARLSVLVAVVAAAAVWTSPPAEAQEVPIDLGSADNFAVLAGQGVTNVGATTLNGDLGSWPNPALPPAGMTVNGSVHAADEVAKQAQADTTLAYNEAASRTPTTIDTELGGQVLLPGVYNSLSGTFQITGTLTLDGQGDPNAVFIFQTESTLVTASTSVVSLIDANPCNVFWQVGSSATLGTNSTFLGTIMALTSIEVLSGATIEGRALARNASVTLDNNTITRSTCDTPETTTTTLVSSPNPSGAGGPVTFTATVTASGGGTPTGSVAFLANGMTLGTAPLDSNGQATFSLSSLEAGRYSITAVYLGAPGFENSASAALIQDVNPGLSPAVPVPAPPRLTG